MAAAALPQDGIQQQQQQQQQHEEEEQHRLLAAAALAGDVAGVLGFLRGGGRPSLLGSFRDRGWGGGDHNHGGGGATLFHLAAARGHAALVAALLAERRQRKMEGKGEADDALLALTPGTRRSALFLAALHGHTEACEALLLPLLPSPAATTHPHYDQEKEAATAAAWLLRTPDHRGATPLIAAATGGHAPVVRLLLLAAAAADEPPASASSWTNARDGAGRTAFFQAARFGRRDVLGVLVAYGGADPTLGTPGVGGGTPLAAARAHVRGPGREACLRVIEDALAEPQRTELLCRLRAVAEEAEAAQAHAQARASGAVSAAGELIDAVAAVPVPPASASASAAPAQKPRTTLLEAVVAQVVTAGGAGPLSLSDDMFRELMDYMMPAWDPRRGGPSSRPRRDGGGGGCCSPR